MAYKLKQQGFTIVELLIVIVVIGILAALVITTFTGIQQKARNTERETDIKALQSQVEAYFASAPDGTSGRYPTLANMQDIAAGGWVKTNMKGLDVEAERDPKGAVGQAVQGSAASGQYAYIVTPAGCDNSTTDCTGYTLTATYEGTVNGQSTFTKTALN